MKPKKIAIYIYFFPYTRPIKHNPSTIYINASVFVSVVVIVDKVSSRCSSGFTHISSLLFFVSINTKTLTHGDCVVVNDDELK